MKVNRSFKLILPNHELVLIWSLSVQTPLEKKN